MFTPRLQGLFGALGAESQRYVQQSGITSVLETNVWDTAEEYLSGCTATAATKAELASFWSAAQGACALALRQAVVRHTEDSSCLPVSTRSFFAPSRSAPTSALKPSTGCTPHKKRRLRQLQPTEASQHLQNLQLRERQIVEQSCTELWKLFLEVGEQGTLWQEYSKLSSCDREHFASMFFDELCLVSVTSLQSALRVVDRWRRHCQDTHIHPWQASSIHVALWLRSLRERGPTAPNGAFHMLKWLEGKIGIVFHSSSDRVRGQSAIPSTHEEEQATPLSLQILLALESLVPSRNHAVAALALTWIVLSLGVLRFAHLQRSTIVRILDNGVARAVVPMAGDARSTGDRPGGGSLALTWGRPFIPFWPEPLVNTPNRVFSYQISFL